jgi:hypothetical protein
LITPVVLLVAVSKHEDYIQLAQLLIPGLVGCAIMHAIALVGRSHIEGEISGSKVCDGDQGIVRAVLHKGLPAAQVVDQIDILEVCAKALLKHREDTLQLPDVGARVVEQIVSVTWNEGTHFDDLVLLTLPNLVTLGCKVDRVGLRLEVLEPLVLGDKLSQSRVLGLVLRSTLRVGYDTNRIISHHVAPLTRHELLV